MMGRKYSSEPFSQVQYPGVNGSHRTGKMLKIKDLLKECNQKSSVDMVAVIVSVGDLKLAPQVSKQTVAAREIFLYDDSWAMIKLIVRDHYAQSSRNYKPDQILFLKNIKPMKLRNYVVLATMSDTVLSVEKNTPEAKNLKCWFAQYAHEFQDEGYKRFLNLSVSPEKAATIIGQAGGSNVSFLSFTENSPVENASVETQQFNNSVGDENMSTENIKLNESTEEEVKTNSEKEVRISAFETSSGEPSTKYMRVDLTTTDVLKPHDKSERNVQEEQNTTIQSVLTQSPNADDTVVLHNRKCADGSSQILAQSTDEIIISDDEKDETEKQKIDCKIKQEVNDESAEEDQDVIYETFNTLMNCTPLEEEWNEERDKYLVNFITKNCGKLQSNFVYNNLLTELPDIFKGVTSDMLKYRAEALASVENYFYLMTLCGGNKIKSEREKCVFIDRVEKLRKSMQSSTKKELTI